METPDLQLNSWFIIPVITNSGLWCIKRSFSSILYIVINSDGKNDYFKLLNSLDRTHTKDSTRSITVLKEIAYDVRDLNALW